MRIHPFLLLALLLGGAVQAAERPQDFRQTLPLQLSGEGPWYRLELPIAAHLAARHGDLRDLRVFDAGGQAQAYALIPGRSETLEHEQEHGVRIALDQRPHRIVPVRHHDLDADLATPGGIDDAVAGNVAGSSGGRFACCARAMPGIRIRMLRTPRTWSA